MTLIVEDNLKVITTVLKEGMKLRVLMNGEVWTRFIKTKDRDGNPIRCSVLIGTLKIEGDTVYLCTNSPLCYREPITPQNTSRLMEMLCTQSNWSVPWQWWES